MLKHATISRTSKAQLPLDLSWNVDKNQRSSDQQQQLIPLDVVNSGDLNNNSDNKAISPFNAGWLATTRSVTSCSSSPTPSMMTTPTSKCPPLSSAPSSVFSSPTKSNSSLPSTLQYSANRHIAGSMIKIFAQTLSQDVEYVTLHLNTQTKSQQVIRTLLKKFRLKHRDPNLFYLTLERWIRKDGVKFKSVMLLGDNACPLQLQQCCPPHDESKFTLLMRSGSLIKIFCSDVCANTKYKCLSLASQTTVEETIGLMLHCLNLTVDCESKQANESNDDVTQNLTTNSATGHHHNRQTSSPSSTDCSSSSASSTPPSSGIETDLMNQNPCRPKTTVHQQAPNDRLDAGSRASSIASISSASNLSSISSGHLFSDHYCLVIECENTNYKRVLAADDCLVELYQALLDEAREQSEISAPSSEERKSLKSASSASRMLNQSMKSQLDQWFVIKLQRRDDLNHHTVKLADPRQNRPLPPIPPSLAQFSNVNNLQSFVSTAQIEVNHHQRRPNNIAFPLIKQHNNVNGQGAIVDGHSKTSSIATACSRPVVNCHRKQISAIVNTGCERMPPPPQALVWLPPITPRRRNLSNASSTFGRPQNGLATGVAGNRRRYDPVQLAEDLNQLNLSVEPIGPFASQTVRGGIGVLVSDQKLVIEQNKQIGPKTQVDTQ